MDDERDRLRLNFSMRRLLLDGRRKRWVRVCYNEALIVA